MSVINSHQVRLKDAIREKLQRDMEAFLASDREIETVAPGVFADPARAAHKAMRNRIEQEAGKARGMA